MKWSASAPPADLVLQDGGVGVDGLLSARQAQVKGVVHVGVAGGELSNLQPTGTENREEGERMNSNP